MDCPKCGSDLKVANSKFVSQEASTEVYSELTMVCINPRCDNFAGKDLNEPLKVAATIKNKVG